MNNERWAEVVHMLEQSFTVSEHDTAELEDEPGSVEWFVFNGPMGRMRLERYVRPKVTGSRMIASKRIGGSGREEKMYSDTETVSFIKLWKWNESMSDWEELDPSTLVQ